MEHELNIAAVPGRWRLFMVRRSDPAFINFRDAVFKRDNYTCQFCGFRSKNHQEIANLDGDYTNNKRDNLVTACCFCSQCFFLESVGITDNSGGKLIYLPKISQKDLNGFCHFLFCTMNERIVKVHEAEDLYLALQERATIVEKYLGRGMSNPSLFGKLLLNLTDKTRKQMVEKILPSIRLLPGYQKFKHLGNLWSNETFRNFLTVPADMQEVNLFEDEELTDNLG